MLREDILKFADTKEIVFTEGVHFFKFSKRLDKLIKKAALSKNPKKKEFIAAISKAKQDFVAAETEYDMGNKTKGKEMYKAAKVKNNIALKKLMDNEMKSFVLRAGLFGLFAGVIFLLTKGTIDLQKSGKLEEIMFKIEDSAKDIGRDIQYFGKEKDVAYYDSKFKQIIDRSVRSTNDFLKEYNKAAPVEK